MTALLGSLRERDLSYPTSDEGDTTLSYTQAAALANGLHGVTVSELQSVALGQSSSSGEMQSYWLFVFFVFYIVDGFVVESRLYTDSK